MPASPFKSFYSLIFTYTKNVFYDLGYWLLTETVENCSFFKADLSYY